MRPHLFETECLQEGGCEGGVRKEGSDHKDAQGPMLQGLGWSVTVRGETAEAGKLCRDTHRHSGKKPWYLLLLLL